MADKKDYKALANEYNKKDYTSLADQYNKSEEVPVAEEAPGYLETIAHQAPQGLLLGLSDELKGLVSAPSGAYKTLANLMGGNYSPQETEEYKKVRDEERATLAATQEANPKTAFLSQLVGGLLPGGAVAKGVGMFASAPITGVQTALRAGALEGTLYGAGQSEADTGAGVAKEAATGTVLGGALGGTVGQLGKFLGGNAADVASGASKELERGVLSDLAESKIGQRVKTLIKGGSENIDTSTKGAESTRGVSNLAEATKITKSVESATKKVGKQIEKNISEAGEFVPESVTILPSAPDAPPISAEMLKSKNAYVTELDSVSKQLTDALVKNPEDVTAALREGSQQLIDPELLKKAMPYIEAKKGLLKSIQDILDENPQATLEQLEQFVISKTPASKVDPELQTIFDQLRQIATVDKLIKTATDSGMAPDPGLQAIAGLRQQKTKLQKIVNDLSPQNKVKSYIPQLDESLLSDFEKVPAKELQDIVEGFVSVDGTVPASETYEFRNQLNNYIKRMQGPNGSTKMVKIAKNLEKEIGDFRRVNAGKDLSKQYHDLKSFTDMLKIDTSGKTQNEIDNIVSAKMAKFVETLSSKDSLGSGRMEDMLEKLVKANNDDQKILDSIAKIKENVSWSDVHKLKSGSEGSIFNDAVNRIAFAFPLETAGKISANPLVKIIGSTTSSTANKLLSLPSAGWRYISNKTSSISPTMSKLATTMAETTDAGKKRAILNSLNQMPAFRKAIENMYGSNEEE